MTLKLRKNYGRCTSQDLTRVRGREAAPAPRWRSSSLLGFAHLETCCCRKDLKAPTGPRTAHLLHPCTRGAPPSKNVLPRISWTLWHSHLSRPHNHATCSTHPPESKRRSKGSEVSESGGKFGLVCPSREPPSPPLPALHPFSIDVGHRAGRTCRKARTW
jgi:hypothetical protein